jgi:DNA-binding MarR family transcriptional regulator
MTAFEEYVNIRETLQLLVRRFGLFQKEGAQCCGVSVMQSHILYELRKRPNQSLLDLAGILGVDTSSLSRQVQQLVELGLVNRVPDPKDRRYVLLSLTQAGEKMDSDIANQMTDYIQNLLKFIPEEKHQQVKESLDLLSDAMRQSPNCCTPPM